MRRTSRWAILGIVFALTTTGVAVPPPLAQADDEPPPVQLQPKKCGNFSIQTPLYCNLNCPPAEGCSVGVCGRSDCGDLMCTYTCD